VLIGHNIDFVINGTKVKDTHDH